MVAQVLGGKGNGKWPLMGTGFPLGDEKMFWNWVVFAQPWKYTENHWILYFKMVYVMVYELYFNFEKEKEDLGCSAPSSCMTSGKFLNLLVSPFHLL